MTENITIEFFLVLDTVLFAIRVGKFGINAFLRQPILQGILCRYSRGHAFTWHHRPTVNTRPIPQYVHIDRFPLLLFDLIKRWQDSPNPINATSSERAPQITRRQSFHRGEFVVMPQTGIKGLHLSSNKFQLVHVLDEPRYAVTVGYCSYKTSIITTT